MYQYLETLLADLWTRAFAHLILRAVVHWYSWVFGICAFVHSFSCAFVHLAFVHLAFVRLALGTWHLGLALTSTVPVVAA